MQRENEMKKWLEDLRLTLIESYASITNVISNTKGILSEPITRDLHLTLKSIRATELKINQKWNIINNKEKVLAKNPISSEEASSF